MDGGWGMETEVGRWLKVGPFMAALFRSLWLSNSSRTLPPYDVTGANHYIYCDRYRIIWRDSTYANGLTIKFREPRINICVLRGA